MPIKRNSAQHGGWYDRRTALEHDLAIVTRNVKDFAGLGVAVFNPWDAV
jgi:hypothetical protein